MKGKLRKGFTLIELLIVIAILGTLSAVMAVSINDSTALAKAKASTIASNVASCKTAAAMFYAENLDNNTEREDGTTTSILTKYIPDYADFSTGSITYTPGTTVGSANWTLTVNFSGDNDADKIATALQNLPGYKAATMESNKFTVNLLTGKVTNE